jgi:hypothetical protein
MARLIVPFSFSWRRSGDPQEGHDYCFFFPSVLWKEG